MSEVSLTGSFTGPFRMSEALLRAPFRGSFKGAL